MVSNTPQMTPEDQSDPELLRRFYQRILQASDSTSSELLTDQVFAAIDVLEEARASEFEETSLTRSSLGDSLARDAVFLFQPLLPNKYRRIEAQLNVALTHLRALSTIFEDEHFQLQGEPGSIEAAVSRASLLASGEWPEDLTPQDAIRILIKHLEFDHSSLGPRTVKNQTAGAERNACYDNMLAFLERVGFRNPKHVARKADMVMFKDFHGSEASLRARDSNRRRKSPKSMK